MNWRRIVWFIMLCALAWLTAESASGPPWIRLLIIPGGTALFIAGFMNYFDPAWGRRYPRLLKRMTYAGTALTLGITVLFLLFGEPALETVLGRGSRSGLFLLYLVLFAGTVLLVKRLVANKWNRL
jgi:hypothetical protein